jgi:fermentation-respiration switch protein FrsA (DUF1100 family)
VGRLRARLWRVAFSRAWLGTGLESVTTKPPPLGGGSVHSFGGAVVIQAAAAHPIVRAVAPLSTQSFGVGPASRLSPRCSLLLMHGTDDEILPADCSRYVYSIAGEPKRLVLLDGTRHGLDEAADEVYRTVRDWVVETLRPTAAGTETSVS